MGSLCLLCVETQDKLYNVLEIKHLYQIFIEFVRRDISHLKTISKSICFRCLFKIEDAKEVFLKIRRIVDQQNELNAKAQFEFPKTSPKASVDPTPIEINEVDSKDGCKNLLRPVSYRPVDTLSTESGGVVVLDEELAASQSRASTKKCQTCMQTFQTNAALLQHERSHRKRAGGRQHRAGRKISYACNVCGNAYSSFSSFANHARSHAPKYKCRHCEESFINSNDREWHEPTCVSRPNVEGRVRTRSLSRLSETSRPVADCDADDRDVENFCDRIYDDGDDEPKTRPVSTASSASASSRRRSRSRTKKPKWTRRKRSKYNSGPLVRLTYVASSDEDDEDEDAESGVSTYPSMMSSRVDILNKQHMKLKTYRHYPQRKIFFCSTLVCAYCSPDLSAIVEHEVKKHKALALFRCTICRQDFTTKKFLMQHKRYTHPDGPFMCIYCEKCCPTQKGLIEHMAKHQKIDKDFRCQACNFRFLTEELLKNHWTCTTDSKHLLHDRVQVMPYRQWESPDRRCESPSGSIITISNVTSLAGSSRPSTPFPDGLLPVEYSGSDEVTYEFETLKEIGYGEASPDPMRMLDESYRSGISYSPVNVYESHDGVQPEAIADGDDIEICPTNVETTP